MQNYNDFYISSTAIPTQSIPLKEKLAPGKDNEKSFGEKTLDALDAIATKQFAENVKLIENYEMVKGKFIPNHYFDVSQNDMLSSLAAEMELPTYLRHYDIISPILNTMSGEWQKRPDLFKVRQSGEKATNEYIRVKTELIKKYLFDKINTEINNKLIEQGIDVNKEDFNTSEELQQYQSQISQLKEELTPKDIQTFMDTDFLTLAEMWGQSHHEKSKEIFNFSEKEKTEIEDMFIADRCFRHFYTTPTGYSQETWNPVNVFYHVSQDVRPVEDGDYVGRKMLMTIPTIIDTYGYLMSKEDYEALLGDAKKSKTNWSDSEYDWLYDKYMVPFNSFPTYDIMKNNWNRYADGSIPDISRISYSDDIYNTGFLSVTQAYWKTQKKIYKLTYFDEDTEQVVVKLVDENYVIPKDMVESDKIFTDNHDVNSYCSTYVNEVWKGIKISTGKNTSLKKDLYLGIGPNDFQFKGSLNMYGCKLPVCGEVFSVRNSKSCSLVDRGKTFQILYNVAMNQLFQIASKEIGMFAIIDVNMFVNNKDWGGEDSWEKWMLMAKNFGLLPADTSPQNVKGSLSAAGGYLPKIMDLNLASQMVSRMNIAKFAQEQLLQQLGFNGYRLGSFSQSSTATGIQEGMAQSYAQTESYFTNFSNYLRRCHQMNLDIAQYVESQKDDVSFIYAKSDLSKAFIKIAGADLLLSELGVFVSNSQEHARQLEMLRQFALNNNTSGMTPMDVADIISTNSAAEIRKRLSISFNKQMEQQQAIEEAKAKQNEQLIEVENAKIEAENKRHTDLMNNNLDREKIRAGVAVFKTADDLEITQPSSPTDNSADTNIKQESLALNKAKAISDDEYRNKKLALDKAKIDANILIQNKETESAKILKGKKMP